MKILAPNIPRLLLKSGPYSLTLITLALLAISGLSSPYDYNWLPAFGILEFTFLISASLIATKPKRELLPLFAVLLVYLVTTSVIAYQTKPTHTLDYLQAYKAFFYLLPIPFLIKSKNVDPKLVLYFFYFLIFCFLLKYSYSRVAEFTPRMADRPGLYGENNFELIFLILLYYLLSIRTSLPKAILPLLAVIIVLSGSRSAALTFLAVFFFAHLSQLNYRSIIYIIVLPAVVAIVYYVVTSRGELTIETIDRFKFFNIFLYEIRHWSIFDFLLGTKPITPLSGATCSILSYYDDLYSLSGDQTCYSVILHSYILRVIFDHGVLGLLFIIIFYYSTLKLCKFSSKDAICFITIMLLSALSVSSFNSIFSPLALLFFIALKGTHEKETIIRHPKTHIGKKQKLLPNQ
ncbi:hypothetical protein [Halopseudomonas salegens]|uniref:O-antigen ligase-like membrane protein n=1 Tax=Halopseudomonas salegens TaxID=1434072 RepID=A0A1H2FLY4_9GAMM|nr:hypothetical protein [Halopseudomonas salegens]SDU08363.1 hypothetical protein SAMN05216210_1657 [Halopseudomonas salegens]